MTDWLIVGLGNIGERYAATRHNIGFMVAEAFCRKHGATFRAGKGEWSEARVSIGRASALVILPTTYMNASGRAARKAATQERVPAMRIVAVVDEYNFPVGRIHLKNSGSNGGHNGTASMIEELRTNKFLRLRCGIDHKFGPGELVDYVLKPFASDEHAALETMIANAVLALETLMQTGEARAMQIVNAETFGQPAESAESAPVESALAAPVESALAAQKAFSTT
jgi:peptidyl-tRNA hydrolase, PTH1 family